MPLIKPPGDWSEEVSGYYDGPPPDPGTYKGKVTFMGLGEIASGENQGKPKIAVAVEITEGKFKGAGIITSFPLFKQNAWSLNQFLMSMTDGSEKQKAGIRKLFFKQGYHTTETERKGLGTEIEAIGAKKQFTPKDKPVRFITTMNGQYASIDRFLIPQVGEGSEEPEPESPVAEATTEESTGDLSGLDEFDSGSEQTEEAEAVAVESSDDDDPWG